MERKGTWEREGNREKKKKGEKGREEYRKGTK